MSRARGPVLISRLLQSTSQTWCRAAAVTAGFEALTRSSLPALLGQLPHREPAEAVFQGSFAVRPLSSAAAGASSKAEEGKGGRGSKDAKGALAVEQEGFDAITDQIPQRPMGVVEGTSYTVLIAAGIAIAGAVLWAVVNELLIQPREYSAFSLSLDRLRDDPRVAVTLGTPVSGYGQESNNRAARQRIPHRIYTDNEGREHVQVQFIARGPSGKGRVSADMYQDSARKWQYYYLLVDVDGGRGRISIVDPHHHY